MHKRDILWVISILVALVVAILTYFLPLPSKGSDDLLITISQGLAAIFTLVFTVTIFAAQMTGKFTAMDRMVDKTTKILMIIFAIGIILPLIQLRTDVDLFKLSFINTANLSLTIDLFIVTFCILAIIPFLNKVNNIMKYEGGVSKLSEEASEAVDSNYNATVSNRIGEIIELGSSAVNNALEHEAIKTVGVMKNLGKSFVKKRLEDATFATLGGLEQIGNISIEKKLDFVTGSVLDALEEIGIKATDIMIFRLPSNRWELELALNTIKRLKSIGESAINNNLPDDTVIRASLGIGEIATKAIERKIESEVLIFEAVDSLKYISNEVYKNKEYLFSWEDIPNKDTHKVIKFIKKHNYILRKIEHIEKTDENRVINISDGKSLFSFNLIERKNMAVMTVRHSEFSIAKIGMDRIFSIKKENNKLNVYEYEFERTLEYSLSQLWVLGYFVKEYLPKYAENTAKHIKKDLDEGIKDLFESDYIRDIARQNSGYLAYQIEDFEKLYNRI